MNKNLVVGVIVVLAVIATVAVLRYFVTSSVVVPPLGRKSTMLGDHIDCPMKLELGEPAPGKPTGGDIVMLTYPPGKAADAASILCNAIGSGCGGISYNTLDDTRSLVFFKGPEGTKPILDTKMPGWQTRLAM